MYYVSEWFKILLMNLPTKGLHEVFENVIENSGNIENVPTYAILKSTIYKARQGM